jgi:hypothetical protein
METKQKQTNHDWIYLLPDSQTANNMKDACEIIAEQKGHKFGSNSFKYLVKIGVVKKINRNNFTRPAECNGNKDKTPSE